MTIKIILRLMLALLCAHAANTVFVDEMTSQNFEKVYKRADYMTTDFRQGDELFNDVTRYKRDFAGATRWEAYTYVIWRWPDGARYNNVWLMTYELNASSVAHNALTFGYSNDGTTFTTFDNTAISKTTEFNSLNNYRRANYTISSLQPFRFFRVEWTGCPENPNCLDYWSPSLGHICAINSPQESISDDICFPNGLNPPNIDPSTSYCGVKVIDNFWRASNFGNFLNVLGGATSAGGDMIRRGHGFHFEGIGSGFMYILPASPVPPANVSTSYWYSVMGPSGNSCVDTSEYTHLSIAVTASAGCEFNIQLEVGNDETCTKSLPEVVSIPSTSMVTYDIRKNFIFLIPLTVLPNRQRFRSLILNKFVNPTNEYIHVDNVVLVGKPVPPPLFVDRFESGPKFLNLLGQVTSDSRTMELFNKSGGQLQLSPKKGRSVWYTTLGVCQNVGRLYPQPALKFDITANLAHTDFTIELAESNSACSKTAVPQIARTGSVRLSSYLTITLDTANLLQTVTIPLSNFQVDATRLHSISIAEITPSNATVTLDNIRFGSADCLEPENPLSPDFTPKPPYYGFQRSSKVFVRRALRDEL